MSSVLKSLKVSKEPITQPPLEVGKIDKLLSANSFGRVPSGRAIRYKSSLVPHCGLFASIPHAKKIRKD